jgi:transcriptional regulator with XRE-family HTH domain
MTRSGRKGKGAGRGRPLTPRTTPLREMLTAVRLEAGLTQAEMAELMCTSSWMVTRWETGGSYPTLTTLEKIAEVTGRKLEIRFV